MNVALQVMADGTRRLVDANGQPLGVGDSDRPILHVLPKLYVPSELLGSASDRDDGLICEDITLTVTTSLPVDIVPAEGLRIRQPYPNRRYFVGGSALIRNGWIIPLPEGVTEFDLEFHWLLEGAALWRIVAQDTWEVRHKLHIKLNPGKGHTYSMDAACWPQRAGAAMHHSPITLLGLTDETTFDLTHRNILQEVDLVFSDDEGGQAGYLIEENVAITGVPLEQAWSIDAFEEEQLHEVEQTAYFPKGNEPHRANATIEMPIDVLLQAIKAARKVPFEAGSAFAASIAGVPGGYERHPAMRLLCEWWESVRPEGEPFKPGSAMPLIRVRDDGEYWWGYYEIPNASIAEFNPSMRDAARIGDLGLVLFAATQETAVFDEQGMHVTHPSGAQYNTVGVTKAQYLTGEWDEACYALRALAAFPSRFTAAWEFLNRRGAEYRKWQRASVAIPVPIPEGLKKCPQCLAVPVFTDDPTGQSGQRFEIACSDHAWIAGDTPEEAIASWNDDYDFLMMGADPAVLEQR